MTEEDCLRNPKIEVTVSDCYECHIYVRNADQNQLQTVIINCNRNTYIYASYIPCSLHTNCYTRAISLWPCLSPHSVLDLAWANY